MLGNWVAGFIVVGEGLRVEIVGLRARSEGLDLEPGGCGLAVPTPGQFGRDLLRVGKHTAFLQPAGESTILSADLQATVALTAFGLWVRTREHHQLVDQPAVAQQPDPAGLQVGFEPDGSSPVSQTNQQVGDLMVAEGYEQPVFPLLDANHIPVVNSQRGFAINLTVATAHHPHRTGGLLEQRMGCRRLNQFQRRAILFQRQADEPRIGASLIVGRPALARLNHLHRHHRLFQQHVSATGSNELASQSTTRAASSRRFREVTGRRGEDRDLGFAGGFRLARAGAAGAKERASDLDGDESPVESGDESPHSITRSHTAFSHERRQGMRNGCSTRLNEANRTA